MAAREVERQQGQLRRGVLRRTSQVVFGRTLLARAGEAAIEARLDAERGAGRRPLSENGFLRLLGLLAAPETAALPRQSLIDQARLSPRVFDLLSLFDAFEHDAEPFSFRDLILARKFAGLIAAGATWSAIARSVHRGGPVTSLSARSLHAEGGAAIYVRNGGGLSELDGQLLLELGQADAGEIEDLFAQAEAAEAAGRHDAAAAVYLRCLALDPADAVAAFNRANCLRAAGRSDEAAHEYARAIKFGPDFVEAWFNLAGLMRERGRVDAARRHLLRAIALDVDYGDAVFNLATLEYDAGNLAEARRWWSRYLELDSDSDWARTAARGVRFVDLRAGQGAAG
ncbi:MAG: tetratricopeptide repeat protein [Rhodobacteraceae bacterium]|nr:tetratricopeptide repeat protein [Paracoccaceae bacterium]